VKIRDIEGVNRGGVRGLLRGERFTRLEERDNARETSTDLGGESQIGLEEKMFGE